MISILIPTYNYSILELVQTLHVQGSELSCPFEIRIIDDASEEIYHEQNKIIAELEHVQYRRLSKNTGRSKIRNILATEARYDYFLFMDCDAKVSNNNFLKCYIEECHSRAIVCGGTDYEEDEPVQSKHLRWYYGIKREKRSAEERNIEPNSSFSTFNFLVSKEVFQEVGFDEKLSRYGHEDTLFGLELKQKGYIVKHINNPLVHLGLDSNKDFVFKTKQSIKNLYILTEQNKKNPELYTSIKVLHYYKKLHNFGVTRLVGFLYKVFHGFLEQRIIAKNNLVYFDLLKLGYFCTLKQ